MSTLTDVKLKTASYVILYVRDTEKSLPFYRDTLGMTVKEAHPGWVELDAGTFTLALHGAENVTVSETSPTVVFATENIHGTVEALEARGVKFLEPVKEVCGDETHVGLSATFKDADDNPLSVFEYKTRV